MLACLLWVAAPSGPGFAQDGAKKLVESGQLSVEGRRVPYRIRRLPVSSFPELPIAIAAALEQRGCMIPQTYQAHRPENVIRGSLERAGSADWAALCSSEGTVTLLVFFSSDLARPTTLATSAEVDRLQAHDSTGEMGFDWGIDPASPEAVHQAQSGMERRPPRPDHDALADTTIDRRTVYRLYTRHAWTVVDTTD